jgi:hypothetical protein
VSFVPAPRKRVFPIGLPTRLEEKQRRRYGRTSCCEQSVCHRTPLQNLTSFAANFFRANMPKRAQVGQRERVTAALSGITDPSMREAIAQAKNTVERRRMDLFDAHMAKAEEHRKAREYEEAAAALQRAAALRLDDPRPHFQLCMVQTAASDVVGACRSALRTVELAPGGHLGVLPSELRSGNSGGPTVPRGIYPQIGLRAAVMAFDLLVGAPACASVPRPPWWSDGELLAMSERALADTPQSPYAIRTRTDVLIGVSEAQGPGVSPTEAKGGVGDPPGSPKGWQAGPRGWTIGPRKAAHLREGARHLKAQASFEPAGSVAAAQKVHNAAALLEVALRMEASELSASSSSSSTFKSTAPVGAVGAGPSSGPATTERWPRADGVAPPLSSAYDGPAGGASAAVSDQELRRRAILARVAGVSPSSSPVKRAMAVTRDTSGSGFGGIGTAGKGAAAGVGTEGEAEAEAEEEAAPEKRTSPAGYAKVMMDEMVDRRRALEEQVAALELQLGMVRSIDHPSSPARIDTP